MTKKLYQKSFRFLLLLKSVLSKNPYFLINKTYYHKFYPIKKLISNRTQYFNVISEFVNEYNLYENKFLNIFYINLRNINANIGELFLFF